MSSYPGWGSWSFQPVVVIVLLAAAVAYARVYRRAGRALLGLRPGHRALAAVRRRTADAGGGAALAAGPDRRPLPAVRAHDAARAALRHRARAARARPALAGAAARLSREALLAVAPAGRSGRVLARLTSPWLAVPLWALATWVWAIPSVFDFAAQHAVVHAAEHATLFYTGLAMWWLIIDPLPRARLRPNSQRLALLGFTRLASACVCLPLTWLSATEYPLYAGAPRAYGLSAINDQHLAGASMCFIELLVFGIAFAAVFISILGRADSREALGEYAAAGSHVDRLQI